MLRVRTLLKFSKSTVFINSSATFREVCTKMISEDVSYLPIIDGPSKNLGVYSRKEIFKWLCNNPNVTADSSVLKNLREAPLDVVDESTGLDRVLDLLERSICSAVLVKINGSYPYLISPRVVSKFLETYSVKFRRIEEIEQILRLRIARNKIDIQEISGSGLINPLPESPDQLTFSQYATILSQKHRELGYNFDLKQVMKLFESANDYRNAVMHFRIDDSIVNEGGKSLEKLLKLLR